MQTEVPTLPVVHLNVHTNLNRKQNSNLRSPSEERKNCSQSKNVTHLSFNKKSLHPLLGGPYRSNVRQQSPLEPAKVNKSSIGQRVFSAKMLRLKELQNQLSDAHYHLNELANENRLLKALQKRQDSALKRYEGTNAELPRIIHSHHEELRVLQIKYKNLKTLHKETCNTLKEKENELQCLQLQNKHLLQLSKDRNLGEREKLQLQVSDLNHRIQQQQETIQALHRKLTLESKSLKHQLNVELSKRKEVQKNLVEATEKLRTLENLLDNRERRLYYNGQLSIRNKNLGTQSLTNLRDVSTSNPLKLPVRDKKWQGDVQENSLPALSASESNDAENLDKPNHSVDSDLRTDSAKTETMTNLQQIRKYRLQKSSRTQRSSLSDELELKSKDLDKLGDMKKMQMHSENSKRINVTQEKDVLNQYETDADELKRIYDNRKYPILSRSPNERKTELYYSSENSESEDECRNFEDNYSMNVAKNSRELHARLVSSADETSDPTEDLLKKSDIKRKEENFNTLLADESGIPNNKYKIESKISEQRNNEKDTDESNSELESQTRNGHVFENKYFHNLESSLDSKIDRYGVENVTNNPWYDVEYNDHRQVDVSHRINDTKKYRLSKGSLDEQENSAENTRRQQVGSKQQKSSTELKQDQTPSNVCTEVQDSSVCEQKTLSHNVEISSSTKSESRDIESKLHAILGREEESISGNTFVDNVETKNKLNTQEVSKESETLHALQANTQQISLESHETYDKSNNGANEVNGRMKVVNYNKEKLLATMKAIDDNENIEFLSSKYQKLNLTNRNKVTENVYHGLPTQLMKKQDIIKDIFETDNIENKPKSNYNNLH